MATLHGFGGQLLLGALTTVQLAAASLVLGALLGAVGCWLQLSGRCVLRAIGNAYAAVVRGVPDLLVVFAVFFGGALTLASLTGRYVEIDTFVAGVVALGLSFGAYAAEIGGEGPHRYVLMCLVALEDPGLAVLPTHRLVRGLDLSLIHN